MSESIGIPENAKSDIAKIREWTGRLLEHRSDQEIYKAWQNFSAYRNSPWLEIDGSTTRDFIGRNSFFCWELLITPEENSGNG